jgi:hypothetical protein
MVASTSEVAPTGEGGFSPAQAEPDPAVDALGAPDAWIQEIRSYLKYEYLPDDDVSAERLIWQAWRYGLVEGDLYRRGLNGVLLKCIS